ncbi:hypothetical protein GCM10023190_05600 [Enteractinococcus fodinae]
MEDWNAWIERGLVRISTVTRLELGFSARSGNAGRQAFQLTTLSLMPIEYLTPAMRTALSKSKCCLRIEVNTERH